MDKTNLPPLPEPTWLACDTPGADFDVTFYASEEEALSFEWDGKPVKLYTAEQMHERDLMWLAKLEAARAVLREPEDMAERLERLREIAYRDEAKRATVATDDLKALVDAARAVREAGADGWVLSSERLPEIDVPVWGVLPGGHVLLVVRTEFDDGYAWCNTYNRVSFWKGKWTADDAEFDDDYPVFAWHPLPDMSAAPTQNQENGS